MKAKKDKKFKILFSFIAIVIASVVALKYISAPTSNAEEPVIVVDETIEVDTTGEVPVFEDAVECYMYAEKMLSENSCYSTITGYVKGSVGSAVMVHQTMENTRIIDNNGNRYSTSNSEKNGNFGKNNYQKLAFDYNNKNGCVYKMVTDKLKSDGTPDFTNKQWQKGSQDEFINASGNLPGSMLYLVRPSTVKKVEVFERLEDGSYHMKLILNNRTSVVSYKKLVKTSAGDLATGYPSFSKVEVECWIDANGNYKKHIMDDTASIPMGFSIVSVDCTMVSHYEETFHIMGGNVEQPFEVPFI